MADSQVAKKSKSKSNNDKSQKSSSQSQSQIPTSKKGSGTLRQKKDTFKVRSGSVLEKLDLEYLRETALKNMTRINSSLPTARDACIDYALDLVIGNLILNGHLDSHNAQNLRNQQIKSEIASICDDMISAKAEISNASHTAHTSRSTSRGGMKKASKSSSRAEDSSRQNRQKWALQPASLPITIITDVDPNISKLPKFKMVEKHNNMSTGNVKTKGNASTGDSKKQKSDAKNRTKSLDSSLERNNHASNPPRSLSPIMASSERQNHYHQQASSEVPSSNHSLENNLKQLQLPSNDDNSIVPVAEPSSEVKMSQESSSKQAENSSKNSTDSPSSSKVLNNAERKVKDEESGSRSTALAPPRVPSFDRNQVLTPTSPTTRTLNSLISSNNSRTASPAGLSGYQMLVDLKGFQNDEISMEVEGRQLIFLATRPKRNELNVRKVTEIVDIPDKVNMENLKIGRRIDGYVIIEEYDS